MKKSFCLSLLYMLFSTFAIAQNPLQKYAPRQMRDDIDTLVKYLEQTHPNCYYRYPKANFYKDAKAVKNSFNRSLTKVEFYLAAEPLLAKLDDGHTDFHIMQEFNSHNPFVIPYFFKLTTTNPFITCTGAYQTINPQLPAGAWLKR